jgi:pilus assembly protein CpaC
VRPEVSDLDYSHSVSIGGFSIPGLKTRHSETTVELGSGQSMVISGLMQNNTNSTKSGPPGIGDVPVLGALFRSSAYQRGETELMIVVTPYLVKPVNANQLVLPTDGYKAPTDLGRVLLGKNRGGTTGAVRPKPTMAPPATRVGPAIGAMEPEPRLNQPLPANPVPDQVGQAQPAIAPQAPVAKAKRGHDDDAAPGFGS